MSARAGPGRATAERHGRRRYRRGPPQSTTAVGGHRHHLNRVTRDRLEDLLGGVHVIRGPLDTGCRRSLTRPIPPGPLVSGRLGRRLERPHQLAQRGSSPAPPAARCPPPRRGAPLSVRNRLLLRLGEPSSGMSTVEIIAPRHILQDAGSVICSQFHRLRRIGSTVVW